MTCPETSWSETLAHRFDPHAHEPADWESLHSHLKACDGCRREAVAVDPSLLFSLRAAAPESPGAGTRGEAEAMVQAVTTMRRTARVERRTEESRRSGLDRLRNTRWTHWAAAAALAVAGLAYGGLGLEDRDAEPGTRTAETRPVGEASPLSVNAARVPVFEGLDRPEARVYDWTSEDADVAVLMIVDENLDV